MKILQVIFGMQKAAGTSVFCGEVCNGLSALGHDVTIAVVNPDSSDCYHIDSRVKLVSIARILKDSMSSARVDYDLIHIHALWSPELHKISSWARKNNIPIVWSPHGMLTPWAMHNKWWKKYLAWWLYQRQDLRNAEMLHVTADSEVADVRRMGLKNKMIVAPLGVKVNSHLEHHAWADGKKTLLFVSRIQKKKGLFNLIQAWATLKQQSQNTKHEFSSWGIRIVGPDQENHTAELSSLCNELGVAKDFTFVGPKYDKQLHQEYAAADLFVLPTYSENFGSVVIEALGHAVPVICTKGAPWSELESRRCGWWVDVGVAPLADALKQAMSLDAAQLREMGARGRALVEEKYTWDAVVTTMVKGYEEVLSGRT